MLKIIKTKAKLDKIMRTITQIRTKNNNKLNVVAANEVVMTKVVTAMDKMIVENLLK